MSSCTDPRKSSNEAGELISRKGRCQENFLRKQELRASILCITHRSGHYSQSRGVCPAQLTLAVKLPKPKTRLNARRPRARCSRGGGTRVLVKYYLLSSKCHALPTRSRQ